MLWGYGPAVDILEEISVDFTLQKQEELNILVIGFADGRHILQTIAKFYKHPKKKVHFFVSEVILDMIARQLLLIMTALEPLDKIGLLEKTHLWMELYGNTLIRPNTRKHLVKKAYQLIHMVTDDKYLTYRLPLVDLSWMKYKERDNLETIFQFWAKDRFENVITLWDSRIRQSLGPRYDSKEGVFDWDYYMRLKDIPNCSRISAREYKHWRGTGVAFTWLESEVSESNPTLAGGIVKLGDRLLNHGYLGDIVSPPYLAFATDCEDKDMLGTRNGVNVHRSTDIVEVNLRRMFHEIATQTEYQHKQSDNRQLGVVVTELPEIKEVSQREGLGENSERIAEDPKKKEDYVAIPVENSRVVFLPTSALKNFPKQRDLRGFFDVVMVSQNLIQQLNSDVMNLARCSALLLLETRKFLTTASVQEKEDFAEHLCKLASELECQPLQPVNGINDYIAKFKVK